MSSTFFSDRTTPRYNGYAFLLPGSFISGFLVGAFLAYRNSACYISLIRGAVQASVSAIGLLLQIALTFSFTALICLSRRRWLILLQCFVHSLTFGILTTAAFLAYSSTHWIISAIVLFTRTITILSAFWFWFRALTSQTEAIRRDYLIALLISIVAAVFDISFVSSIHI